MLQLLNPIALVAAAAVIIPVLVHLWNVRKGKTLRVGSIALLSASARKRATSFRINNWPLFLLRCLLVLLAAFILAKPVWVDRPTAAKQAGWILIPQHQLAMAYAQHTHAIDTLLAAGLELHNLSANFEKIQLKDTLTYQTPADSNNHIPLSTWSLLKVLDAQLPAAFPIHLFVNNRLSSYQGNRPITHLALHWNSFTTVDSLQQSPAIAWVTDKGTIRSMEPVSTPAGNYFVQQANAVNYAGGADTSVIRIALYAGKHLADAQYIKAAIAAIGEFTGRRINLTTLSAGQYPATEQHLIFLLDDSKELREGRSTPAFTQSLLSSLAPKGILFQYDTGNAKSRSSWQQEGALVSGESVHPTIYQYLPGTSKGIPVWTLANGQPLLTVTEQDDRLIYNYKGRFNPAWGNLVWESGFVKTILPLVIPAVGSMHLEDLRTIADEQVIPQPDMEQDRSTHYAKWQPAPSDWLRRNAEDLTTLFWVLLFIILLIERIYTYRLQRNTNA